MKGNTDENKMKIDLCMLLPNRYDPNMRIVPQIGIASYISNYGHNVTWILSSEELQNFHEASFERVRIFVVPCKYKNGLLAILSRVFYLFRRMCFVYNNFKKAKYNMVFVRDSIFDGILALYLKRKLKIPFIFEMSNPLEQRWETYKIYSKHLLFWYLFTMCEKFLTMYILKKADLVLPITQWVVDDFVKKGVLRSKMMACPSGVDPKIFFDSDGSKLKYKYDLNNSNIILYVGTMNKERRLDILIRSFSIVKSKIQDIKLLFVGDGNQKADLHTLVNSLGLESDVIFAGRVPQSEVPKYIAIADIGLSTIPPFEFFKLSSPIKMLEYMVMEIPIVANEEIVEQKEIIEESGCGILVKFDEDSIAEGIIELLMNPTKMKIMGQSGYKWIMENRCYEHLARELERKYIEILINNSNNFEPDFV